MSSPRFSPTRHWRALPQDEAAQAGSHHAFVLLPTVFTIVPIAFGVDKLLGLTVEWGQYLTTWIDALVPGTAHQAMLAVGIIVNLVTMHDFYDIALRDFGLLVAALALARLAGPRAYECHPRHAMRSRRRRPEQGHTAARVAGEQSQGADRTTRIENGSMTKLSRLFHEHGQSPWLDNLSRPYLHDGTLSLLVARGVRGVTANPTIIARAIEASDAYDEQFKALIGAGQTVTDAYWNLAITDVLEALKSLRPTFDASDGADGFVSIEVAPQWAHDADATIVAARALHERIDASNLLVKIPATTSGVAAIQAMVGEGRSINVTLIFSLTRYAEVLEAYLSGLETLAERGGALSSVRSVASFFVSRVDTEVDRRLEVLGTSDALALRGRAAVAQAKLAYQLFRDAHTGERWEHLASLGAVAQRPLWASTSTKNPRYPDTMYVDSLIGPDTVNTLAETTMEAFEDHGTPARTVDSDIAAAHDEMRALTAAGIDLTDVGHTLEAQGIDGFEASFDHVLDTLGAKAHGLRDD